MVHRITGIVAISALLCAPAALSAPVKVQAIEISSVDQFNKLYKSDKPMVAMYTTTWCGPCKATKPHFKELAKTVTDVNFCIIDADKFSNTLAKGLRGVPTFKFSHKGSCYGIDGADNRGERRGERNFFPDHSPFECPKA